MTQEASTWRTHDIVRTACGRAITIGRLRVSGPPSAVDRVTMQLAREAHDSGEIWASLTPSESRALAGRLLAQAAAADRDRALNGLSRTGATGPAMVGGAISGAAEVAFVAGESYAADVRGHLVLTDQPAGYGGGDVAPSPTELFVTAIASGVALHVGRYLSRHGVSRDKLRVHAEYAVAGHPARVSDLRIQVSLPADLPLNQIAGVRSVVKHCTVYGTLAHPPRIDIEFA
jgi:putative redox protein